MLTSLHTSTSDLKTSIARYLDKNHEVFAIKIEIEDNGFTPTGDVVSWVNCGFSNQQGKLNVCCNVQSNSTGSSTTHYTEQLFDLIDVSINASLT